MLTWSHYEVPALAASLLAIFVMSCLPVQSSTSPIPPGPSAATSGSPVPTKEPSPTPTFIGTWPVTIDGIVYDALTGLGHPIAGANVRYDRFSYLSLPPRGEAVTDKEGRYRLILLVHDTDSITMSAEAPGFAPFSERHDGVWFFGGSRQINIGLAIAPTPTAAAFIPKPTPVADKTIVPLPGLVISLDPALATGIGK